MNQASQQEAIRVFIYERLELLRAGLSSLLASWEGIEVVGAAGEREAALKIVSEKRPNVVVVDIDTPDLEDDPFDFLAALRESDEKKRVLLIDRGTDPQRRVRGVLLGAVGVVLKEQPAHTLQRAIGKVHEGEAWLERTMTAQVLSEINVRRDTKDSDPVQARIKSLSDRERAVMALVCEGMQNREIGERLSISEATVRHHLTSIFGKLQLKNRMELVIFAYRNRP